MPQGQAKVYYKAFFIFKKNFQAYEKGGISAYVVWNMFWKIHFYNHKKGNLHMRSCIWALVDPENGEHSVFLIFALCIVHTMLIKITTPQEFIVIIKVEGLLCSDAWNT